MSFHQVRMDNSGQIWNNPIPKHFKKAIKIAIFLYFKQCPKYLSDEISEISEVNHMSLHNKKSATLLHEIGMLN